MAAGEIRRDLKIPPPDSAPASIVAGARPRIKATFGGRKVITEGLERNFWTDFYHEAMTVSWPTFFGALAGVFFTVNLIFAGLYSLADAPIANARPGSFSDLFFFSAETASTVGYGDMYPQTLAGHVLALSESFIAIVLLAVMTGLVFSRFSRPRARLIFANSPVLTSHNGQANLVIRLANARNNFITEATAKLWALTGTVSSEGRRLVGFMPLKLTKSENPVFALSWTLFHPIDADSPLYGLSEDDIAKSEINFVVSISGLDETSAQTVHARHSYTAQDLRVGHEFVDIHRIDDDGVRHVNYAGIHDTRPSRSGDDDPV